MSSSVMRSKDGVPQWNGDASQFQEYEDMCLQWEQSIAHHKRYLCAPRLIAELGGRLENLWLERSRIGSPTTEALPTFSATFEGTWDDRKYQNSQST